MNAKNGHGTIVTQILNNFVQILNSLILVCTLNGSNTYDCCFKDMTITVIVFYREKPALNTHAVVFNTFGLSLNRRFSWIPIRPILEEEQDLVVNH
jgi:hypothetical protein